VVVSLTCRFILARSKFLFSVLVIVRASNLQVQKDTTPQRESFLFSYSLAWWIIDQAKEKKKEMA